MKRFVFTAFLILSFLLVFSQEGGVYLSIESAYDLFLKDSDYSINSPVILNDAIIFYYTGKAKTVVVAGDFNGWEPDRLMEYNNTNFLSYYWDERLPKGKYKYKLLVDGIWINDPNNTNITFDESGQAISYFELKEDFIPYKTFPLWLSNDVYLFRVTSPSANNVYLTGDFNNWNPYSHKLSKKGGGEFEITMRLKDGLYIYCFIVDGVWTRDEYNLREFSDEVGNIVSLFYARGGK